MKQDQNEQPASAGSQQRPSLPSEFMRGRRPELFSDSTQYSELILERDRLEYQLNTITARSEEKVFEHFCRQLCERLICPNLRTQTGPTGGGDSKVDSDTYPVAKAISERWYVGDSAAVGAQDMAFAFSAMKDWDRKVKADVASIASTGRPYTRIYFVTSQLVPDKRKGKMEDSLRKQHGIPVTILDRTWLVEKTLSGKHIDIAVSALGMKDLDRERRKSIGPRDFGREKRLRELEHHLADPAHYAGATYQLVEDALEAALLDRGLGSPREEVKGRFDRAIRLAKANGGATQIMRAKYLWIWSALYWFDDVAELRRGFLELANEYLDHCSVWQMDYLVNLMIAIQSTARLDHITPGAEHAQAFGRVQAALSAAAKRKGSPTHSAWAQTLLLFLRISETAPEVPAEAVKQLQALLRRVRELPEYPVERLLDWMAELLEIAPASAELLSLADALANARSARASVTAAVDLRVKVAVGHLERDEPYEALNQLGRAQVALSKHRSVQEQAWLWTLCAAAYRSAGLPWAARSCIVCAVSTGFSEFERTSVLPSGLLRRVESLVWAEIDLGNVPVALDWLHLHRILAANLRQSVESTGEHAQSEEDAFALQAAFALAALRAKEGDLQRLARLPALYRALGLTWAAEFALLALGHEDNTAAEIGTSVEEVRQAAARLLQQPIAGQIRPDVQWRFEANTLLTANILACRLDLEVDTTPDCLMIAEGLLGFFEALLALGISDDVFAIRDSVHIRMRQVEDGQLGMDWAIVEDECGEHQFEVRVRGGANDAQSMQPDIWARLAVDLATRILHFPSVEATQRIFAPGKGGPDRAVTLVHVPFMLRKLLGDRYPAGSGWVHDLAERLEAESGSWPLQRTGSLQEALPGLEPLDAPAHGRDYLRHADLVSSGLINIALWDKAGWRGFAYAARGRELPVLGVMFDDLDAGRKIFRGWRRRLGAVDERELLLLGAIKHFDRKNPMSYRAVVSARLDRSAPHSGKVVLLPARRLNMMTSHNLTMFEESVSQFGRYLVAPMATPASELVKRSEPMDSDFDLSLSIEKTVFRVDEAWRLTMRDELVLGMSPDVDPIVPPDVTDPPCAEVLAFLRGTTRPRPGRRRQP